MVARVIDIDMSDNNNVQMFGESSDIYMSSRICAKHILWENRLCMRFCFILFLLSLVKNLAY